MARNTSFLPDDYLEKRVVRRTNIICIILFMIVMAGIVGAYYVTKNERAEVRQMQAQVNEQFRQAADRLEKLEKLQNQKEKMIRKARVTSKLMERVPRSTLLAELINHMPLSLSLLSLEVDTETIETGPRPTTAIERRKLQDGEKEKNDPFGFDVKPRRIKAIMVGVAPTDVEVSEYMTSLGAQPMFSDVSLQYSEKTEIDDREMREFRLEIEIADDIDLQQIEPTKVARDLKQDPMSDEVRLRMQQNSDAKIELTGSAEEEKGE
jgi:hypothetical protein